MIAEKATKTRKLDCVWTMVVKKKVSIFSIFGYVKNIVSDHGQFW